MTTETYFDSMVQTIYEDPRPGAWRVLADYLEDDGDSKRAELAAITAEMLEGNPARQTRAQELIKDGVKPVAVKETLEAKGVEFSFSLVPAVYHYYVGVYPVTQAQWRAVMGTDPSDFKGDDRPVEKVSWHDAQEFCKKARTLIGKPVSLLTEAEWEYACRAGTTTEYHSGDTEADLKRAGWYYNNSGNQTHPVGKLEPNVLGLHDMHGNVWEWCQDVYTETPPNVKALTPRPVEGENSSDPPQEGCSGAAAGTTTAGTAGPRTAAGTILSTGATTWAFESATK